MICKRCGNEITNNSTICPHCGAVISQANTKQPATDYGSFLPGEMGWVPPYQQDGYFRPQSGSNNSAYTHYIPQGQPLPPPYQPHSAQYMPGPPVQFTIINTSKNDSALAAELILSLLGIFGIGWIIGGETILGIILIVCSFFIYWPIMILGTAFTLGAGLILLGPLAIGAIIINAILLHTTLKRKTQRAFMMQQQAMHMPPMPPQ
jgi:zinc-ribbon domain